MVMIIPSISKGRIRTRRMNCQRRIQCIATRTGTGPITRMSILMHTDSNNQKKEPHTRMFAIEDVSIVPAQELFTHLTPQQVVLLDGSAGPLTAKQEVALCEFVKNG